LIVGRSRKQEPIDTDALQREFAEKVLKWGEFFKKNRIYAFREPDADERKLEIAFGEKIFTPPNPKQAELLAGWDDPRKKVFTFCGGNRLGKTTIGTSIAISVILGRWPWDDKPLPFMHKRARKVRYVGQGWETHIKAVVIPALKYWWPSNRPLDTKKNNQGVEATWKDVATGSTLEIMSTSQSSDVFEGWDGDLVVYDEPPPRDIRVASARGLIDRQGRELVVATLLKEAWLHREIIKARTPDGKPDMTVFNVEGEIYDNIGFGLTIEGVEQFSKTLKADEKEARLKGRPSYMSSLVFPKMDREKHVKERFKIPLDWIVDFQVDFHPSKPWAIVFMATARNNFKYICNEMEIRGNPKFVGEEIIRYLESNKLRVGRGQIDPLAKGDTNNDNTVYDILSNTLANHNISLEIASKDKDNGIALVNNLLWTENEMPGLFFFEDCVKTIQQTEDLMYDPESLKPTAMKVEDDFTECLYRLALLDTQWYPEAVYDVSSQKSMVL
jgi:hypothetical protein